MINYISKEVLELNNYLSNNGAELYLVGGMPRDYLLYEQTIKYDYDIEIYHLDQTRLVSLLEMRGYNYKIQGEFGVIKLLDFDVELAIPRVESKIGVSHNDFIVNLNPNMSIEEAIKRRDFHINTIMYQLRTAKFIISAAAQEDLNKRRLSYVSNQFSEDPLRVIRAIRFAVVHNLTIETHTYQLCQQIAKELQYISSERIKQEFKQILAASYLNEHQTYLKLYFQDYLNLTSKTDQIMFTKNKYINLYLLQQNYSQLAIQDIASKKDLKLLNFIKKIAQHSLTDDSFLYDLLPFNDVEKMLFNDCLDYFGYDQETINTISGKINQISTLKQEYNGHYFLDRGFKGKAIITAQKAHILELL